MSENTEINYDLEELINIPLGFKITNLSEDYQEIDAEDEYGNELSPTGLLKGEEYLITAIHIYGEDEKGNETYDLRIIGIDESKCEVPNKITEIRYELFGNTGTYSYKNFEEFDEYNTICSNEIPYENPNGYDLLLESIPKKGLNYLSTKKLIEYFKKEIYVLNNPNEFFEEREIDDEEYLNPEEKFQKDLEKTSIELRANREFEEEIISELSNKIKEEIQKYNHPATYDLITEYIKKELNITDDYKEEQRETSVEELTKQSSIEDIINPNEDEKKENETKIQNYNNTKSLIQMAEKTIKFLRYMSDNVKANTYETIIKKLSWGLVDESALEYMIDENYIVFPDFVEAVKVGYPEYINKFKRDN